MMDPNDLVCHASIDDKPPSSGELGACQQDPFGSRLTRMPEPTDAMVRLLPAKLSNKPLQLPQLSMQSSHGVDVMITHSWCLPDRKGSLTTDSNDQSSFVRPYDSSQLTADLPLA